MKQTTLEESFEDTFKEILKRKKLASGQSEEYFNSTWKMMWTLMDDDLREALIEIYTPFPNGFRSWMETHHEIVTHMTTLNQGGDWKSEIMRQYHEQGGFPMFYDLAKDLTDDFEKVYKGVKWGVEIEFFETIESFCKQRL